jgi:hypothetical protein
MNNNGRNRPPAWRPAWRNQQPYEELDLFEGNLLPPNSEIDTKDMGAILIKIETVQAAVRGDLATTAEAMVDYETPQSKSAYWDNKNVWETGSDYFCLWAQMSVIELFLSEFTMERDNSANLAGVDFVWPDPKKTLHGLFVLGTYVLKKEQKKTKLKEPWRVLKYIQEPGRFKKRTKSTQSSYTTPSFIP